MTIMTLYCMIEECFPRYITMKQNGIYVLGLGINKENKILGLSEKN